LRLQNIVLVDRQLIVIVCFAVVLSLLNILSKRREKCTYNNV